MTDMERIKATFLISGKGSKLFSWQGELASKSKEIGHSHKKPKLSSDFDQASTVKRVRVLIILFIVNDWRQC